MERITLKTPWRRGDGQPCKEPGVYLFRKSDGTASGTGKSSGEPMYSDYDYCGPLSFDVPEPMPEVIKPNGYEVEIKQDIINKEWICHCDARGAILCRVRHADKRTCIEAFNAAAKVLEGKQ